MPDTHWLNVDQFFWDRTNTRTDRYGGDLIKRTQFATKIIQAIRTAVGSVGLDNEFTSLYTEGKGAGHKDLDDLLHRLEQEEFDQVAVERALLADPTWAVKIGYPLNEL